MYRHQRSLLCTWFVGNNAGNTLQRLQANRGLALGFAIKAAGGGGVGFGVGAASALSTSVLRVRLSKDIL